MINHSEILAQFTRDINALNVEMNRRLIAGEICSGYTISVVLGDTPPICYHSPSPVPGADMALVAYLVEKMLDTEVNMEFIPLARALKVICSEKPTYVIYAADSAGGQMFACAPPDFIRFAQQMLQSALTGALEQANQMEELNKKPQKEEAQKKSLAPSNVVPFVPPTKH